MDTFNRRDNRLDQLRSIPFYFGRQDCATSPDGLSVRKFPDGHAGWTESFLWFQQNLALTKQETIALIGAHTLGKVRKQTSGFGTRKWVRQSFVLDNQYYADIIAKKWNPEEVNCGSRFGCKWEWHVKSNRNDKTVMLNSDMALWNDIEPFLNRRTGKVRCNWRTCPLNPSTKDITAIYARENQIWLNDFADAFELLITTGYATQDLLAIHIPPSTAYVIHNKISDYIIYNKNIYSVIPATIREITSRDRF